MAPLERRKTYVVAQEEKIGVGAAERGKGFAIRYWLRLFGLTSTLAGIIVYVGYKGGVGHFIKQFAVQPENAPRWTEFLTNKAQNSVAFQLAQAFAVMFNPEKKGWIENLSDHQKLAANVAEIQRSQLAFETLAGKVGHIQADVDDIVGDVYEDVQEALDLAE